MDASQFGEKYGGPHFKAEELFHGSGQIPGQNSTISYIIKRDGTQKPAIMNEKKKYRVRTNIQ